MGRTGICVFFRGKDSTVLLDIARQCHPDIPAVFVNTGLEYPEIVKFVKSIDNVEILRPKMPFHQVIEKYGYPVISKLVSRQLRTIKNDTGKNQKCRTLYLTGIASDGREVKSYKLSNKYHPLIDAPFKFSEQCCGIMKKSPLKDYAKKSGRKPIIGTMAEDSKFRQGVYLKSGCNAFDSKRPMSTPMGFWTEKDIWDYIRKYNIPYSPIYDMGVHRTGCMFCMFGVHLEKGENRFQMMKKTHPKLWDYCINKLGIGKVLDYINIQY